MAMEPKTPFVWGARGQKMTPDEVDRQRMVAQALMAKGADFSPAGHWTEALGRAFNGWASGRLGKIAGLSEEMGLAGAADKVAPYLGGSPTVTASSMGGSPVAEALAAGGPSQHLRPSMGQEADGNVYANEMTPGGYAMGQVADPSSPEYIRQGLIARGLPEHVADGFMMNFQDESGLNPGINEISPIVPGSRGGFGLYQLTGPRRTAYEQFAAQRGVDPSDVDAQLDWLMYELGGPEAGAASAIMGTSTPGEAGAAIVDQFLRPAPEHESARMAKYLGGQQPNYTASTMGGSPVASAMLSGPSSQEIMALMADPWVARQYGPVLQALAGTAAQRENAVFEQNLRMQDPMYQAQLAQLTAPAASPTAEREAFALAGGLQPGSPEWGHYMLTGQMPGGGEGFTLGTDQVRYGPNGEVIAQGPTGTPDAPTTKTITMPDGSQVMVQWNPETQVWDAAPVPTGGTTGAGQPVKLTESQAKTTLFETLQTETAPVLAEIESIWDPANMGDALARSTPIGGNFFQSEEGQLYSAGSAAWAEGALRISTGAAATEPEIQRIQRTYFAQPGDTPNVIAFKRGMREMYSRAIRASLGENIEGAGTLELPEEFAKKYMKTNPPPADMGAAAAPAAGGGTTINGYTIKPVN